MHLESPPTLPRRRFTIGETSLRFLTTHNRVLLIDETGAPNLDGTDGEALMGFWHATYIGGWKVARFLFPDRPRGYVTATGALGGYASNKATAMSCRARGDIRAAETYERICESIYNDLPEWARW